MTNRRPLALGPLLPLACLVASCSTPQAPDPSDAHEQPTAAGTFRPEPLSDEALAAFGLPYELIEGEPMFRLMDHDAIPSIDAPTFVSVDEASAWMDVDETVLGVVGRDGTAKCYSAWQLDDHEIVNDVLDGAPIAATW